MSIAHCKKCDRKVDTDYDDEGKWTDAEFICVECVEEIEFENNSEDYMEWLQSQPDLMICNGDDLIRHFEKQTKYQQFLREYKHA